MRRKKATISARGRTADLDDPEAVEAVVAPVIADALADAAARRQTRIPGTEPTSFPEVNAAADHFLDARAKSKAAREFEKDAKETLIVRMRKRGLGVYSDGAGLLIQLDTEDKVRVTKKRRAPKDED